jgi:hypothetical protein
MAKSIRVSDGIYELAASAGDAVNRSLADQVEYWARLGAALDAAGVTMEQAMRILGGDASLKEQLLSHIASSQAPTHRRRSYSGAASIAARNAQLESDVRLGVRTAESLFALSRDQVRSATFTERSPAAPGDGW